MSSDRHPDAAPERDAVRRADHLTPTRTVTPVEVPFLFVSQEGVLFR